MAYSLAFKEDALKEWRALDNTMREQFKNKLEERLSNPHIPASKLSGKKTDTKSNSEIWGFGWCTK